MNFLWENVFKRLEQSQNISTILSRNILFRNLNKRELKFIENIVHLRRYREGEAIFRQGEAGVGMYIIVKGAVDISIIDDMVSDKEKAREVVVTRLEPGDFFGELALVEEISTRSATAYSSEDTLLVGFFKPDLLEILESSPSIGVKVVFRLAEVLGRRLKETTDKISQLKKEIHLLGELQGAQLESGSAPKNN